MNSYKAVLALFLMSVIVQCVKSASLSAAPPALTEAKTDDNPDPRLAKTKAAPYYGGNPGYGYNGFGGTYNGWGGYPSYPGGYPGYSGGYGWNSGYGGGWGYSGPSYGGYYPGYGYNNGYGYGGYGLVGSGTYGIGYGVNGVVG